MAGFESFKTPKVNKETLEVDREALAEKQLQDLLSDPDNAFLTEIESNKKFIEESENAEIALDFAKSRIDDRLSKATLFQIFDYIEGVSLKEVDLAALKRTLDTILENKVEIGRGGDAYVVVDKNEIRELPPEICYKFALNEATPRGRNSTAAEAELQGLFYDAAMDKPDSLIGVPVPFYSVEIGNKKMIAMEKLPAKSIDDIRRGKGNVPEWLDVDKFCEELSLILGHFHSRHLYHRDMHLGNIMLTQKPKLDSEDKWGYIIDFGLSSLVQEDDFAYIKHVAGADFTYTEDYGILEQVRLLLKDLQSRGVWK